MVELGRVKGLQKLLSISSGAVSHETANAFSADFDAQSDLGKALLGVLSVKNGFYAFESALHVFSTCSEGHEISLNHWNSSTLWRHEYGPLAEGSLFFSEDAFGNQFCLKAGKVCQFDAETGALDVLGDSLEDWADRILAD